MSQFTWIKTHEDIVNYLKDRKERQDEIINLLEQTRKEAIKNENEEDENTGLTFIDPFTFWGYIYSKNQRNALQILRNICKTINSKNIPEDMNGIPSIVGPTRRFYEMNSDNISEQIEMLWKLFSETINNKIEEETFEYVLKIKGNGIRKLTGGLFNVNPMAFLPINKQTEPYLNQICKVNIPEENQISFNEYSNILENVKKLEVPFYKISYDAWVWNEQQNEIKNKNSEKAINNTTTKSEKSMKTNLNQILYGPPGTGKTYNTINLAMEIVRPETYGKYKNDRKMLKEEFDKLLFNPKTETGQIAFVTFHQSYSYEDFIEGIKPIIDEENDKLNNDNLKYEYSSGIFKKLCRAASRGNQFLDKIEWLKNECSELDGKNPVEINTKGTSFEVSYRGGSTFRVKPLNSKKQDADYAASIENIRKLYEGESRKKVYNPTYVNGILEYLYDKGLSKNNFKNDKNYVLIIDEINRGNVSQIFGELITLIEKDKRIGEEEKLETLLPYTKDSFGVPNNIYIIGTMNTADRSVEALDTALRRRFTFIETPPLYDLSQLEKVIASGHTLGEILKTINKRIEVLLDKDHLIGHSYFIFDRMDDDKIVSNTMEAFNNNIIPLLQEYFYGDYGKIGLVLGKGFVETEITNEKFANFKYEDEDTIQELKNKMIFKIKYHNNIDNFETAINDLMNISAN